LQIDEIITKHIFDGIRRVVSKQNDGSCFWYHKDHLGSTGLLKDSSGKVAQQYSYYPFDSTHSNVSEETNPAIIWKTNSEEGWRSDITDDWECEALSSFLSIIFFGDGELLNTLFSQTSQNI
jgi:hypothetical protein